MGRIKESPRYNVLSVRVDDVELQDINKCKKGTIQDFMLEAITEKINRYCQNKMDDYLSKQHV